MKVYWTNRGRSWLGNEESIIDVPLIETQREYELETRLYWHQWFCQEQNLPFASIKTPIFAPLCPASSALSLTT